MSSTAKPIEVPADRKLRRLLCALARVGTLGPKPRDVALTILRFWLSQNSKLVRDLGVELPPEGK